uniref:C2H2-type domain-containing protein n=1 Tax=Hyaloperonospora arabidopsidis (strain Emoy2) TaxID=559515 RepID=M4BTU7_HYAAE
MKENLVCLGLGKAEEYDHVTQLATSERRKLESEVLETAEQVAVRESKSAKDEQVKADVRNMQAAFYCSDCRKQYKSVTEMENHLSSYDHHHTKRLKELQQHKRRVGSEGEQNAKHEKQQVKERLMLQRRIAAQSQAARADTEKIKGPAADVKCDSEKSATTTTGDFEFGGGMKIGMKKKKALAKRNVPSAFSNPFSQ